MKTVATRVRSGHVSASKAFKRALERNKKQPRFGLATAISACPSPMIRFVVEELAAHPIYKNYIALNPFPVSVKHRQMTPLQLCDPEKIYLWNSSVITCFAKRICVFVEKKENFESNLLAGNFEECRSILIEIEISFGQSIWLTKNTILLLQLTAGFVAQKEYLNDILDPTDKNTFYGLIAYYKSAACEQNVSLDSLMTELSNPAIPSNIREYFYYHILKFYEKEIESPHLVVLIEELQTVIDRYESVLEMIRIECAHGNSKVNGYIHNSLMILNSIEDRRIKNLLNYIEAKSPSDWCCSINPVFDQYTMGVEVDTFFVNEKLLELEASIIASQTARLSYKLRPASSNLIIDAMSDVILLTEKSHAGVVYLKKVALMYAPHPITTQLAAFLEKNHFNLTDLQHFSQNEALAALARGFENPWDIGVLASLREGNSGFDNIAIENIQSTALRLMLALQDPYDEGCKKIDELGMPPYRTNTYKGHLALNSNNYSAAVRFYRAAISFSSCKYIRRRVNPHLFTALFQMGQYGECVELAVSHCIHSERSLVLYPVQNLVAAIDSGSTASRTIDFPILVHFSSRIVVSPLGVSLSDAIENFMLSEGVSRPSALFELRDRYDRDRLIFFLRHVCIIKNIDGFSCFDDVKDIENERMLICRLLSEFDDKNAAAYSEEIKSITLEANNAELLHLVQSSMIYVDEEGVLQELGTSIKESYSRFLEFKNMPEMKSDSVAINQKLGGILKMDTAASEQVSSELEGVFANILNEFLVQFATHPAYGLDTHLGTAIRHHTFEGHFRSTFDKEHLLCYKPNTKTSYQLSPKLVERLKNESSNAIQSVQKALEKFTEKIVVEIDRYLNTLLVIRHVETQPQGMFNFLVDKHGRCELMAKVSDCQTYQEFLSRLTAFYWEKVDESLSNIRLELENVTLKLINKELNILEEKITAEIELKYITALLDSIVRARTGFQNSIGEICDWFQRPQNLARGPFEIDSAVAVACTMVKNCWSGLSLNLTREIDVPFTIPGAHLDGVVEILFILIQNIVLHSDQARSGITGSITIRAVGHDIEFIVRNPLEARISVDERRESAALASNRYHAGQEQNLDAAQQSKGSGLSKVWRIVTFELKKVSTLTLEVNIDNEFISSLTIFSMKG